MNIYIASMKISYFSWGSMLTNMYIACNLSKLKTKKEKRKKKKKNLINEFCNLFFVGTWVILKNQNIYVRS